MPNTDSLLREMNHRVKNNLQIIVSLMNLKKRLLPVERRDDIRFLEEHIQAMAVAYRLVYASGAMDEVSVGELLREIAFELRQTAKAGLDQILLNGAPPEGMMGLDQAISFGLYLAVVLPPYLDRASQTDGRVVVSAALEANALVLSISGDWPDPLQPDFLRERLGAAYAGQLLAETLSTPNAPDLRIRFKLERPCPGTTWPQAAPAKG